MGLAHVTAPGRGATDRLLADVAGRLAADGLRVLGALRPADGPTGFCDSDLWLLPDGPRLRITQSLGAGSTACRMDAGALEAAVGHVAARLAADGADIVILNKFGLREADGHGFRALIAAALAQGVPVLIGVSDAHRAAFARFAGGMATALPPDADALLGWVRAVTGATTIQEA